MANLSSTEHLIISTSLRTASLSRTMAGTLREAYEKLGLTPTGDTG